MTDDIERKELAEGADWLLKNKAFTEAILRLRKQWQGEKMATDDEKVMIHLTLKQQALEAIPQQLQILINDERMAQRGKK